MRGALTMEELKTSIILLLRIKKEGAPRRDQTKNKNFLQSLHFKCNSSKSNSRCKVSGSLVPRPSMASGFSYIYTVGSGYWIKYQVFRE